MHRQSPLVALNRNNVLQALTEVIAVAVGHDPTGGIQHFQVAGLAWQDPEEPLRLTEQRRQLVTRQRVNRTQAHQRHGQGQPGDVEQQAFERLGGPGRTAIGFYRWRRVAWRQMHFDNWRHQRLQERRNGRDWCQYRRRGFDDSYRCLYDDRCGNRRGDGSRLPRIPGLFFEYGRLKFVQRAFSFDDLRQHLDLGRQLLGRVLQQVVQIRLERQLRARGDFYRAIHLTPPAERVVPSAGA